MNKFFKKIIKKIKFWLSLFIPVTFNPLRNKHENESEFDYAMNIYYAYIFKQFNSSKQNVINKIKIILEKKYNNYQYDKQIIKNN